MQFKYYLNYLFLQGGRSYSVCWWTHTSMSNMSLLIQESQSSSMWSQFLWKLFRSTMAKRGKKGSHGMFHVQEESDYFRWGHHSIYAQQTSIRAGGRSKAYPQIEETKYQAGNN